MGWLKFRRKHDDGLDSRLTDLRAWAEKRTSGASEHPPALADFAVPVLDEDWSLLDSKAGLPVSLQARDA